MRLFYGLTAAALAVLVAPSGAQVASTDEDLAKRLLESGRSFARQNNYPEALKDFRRVVDTLARSSSADDAWLEIAKFFIDVAGNLPDAATAVDTIIKNYPTSNSAPEAYVIAGRLAMSRSRQSADLEEALANFDRVNRLFPGSSAGPQALAFAGDMMWYSGRFEAALANLARSEAEAPGNPAGAEASLTAGKVLVSLGDPLLALEELQRARDRWPWSPAAAVALGRITLLHRLYVRARGGPAYGWTDESAGPTKLEDVRSLAVTGRQSIYWLNNSRVGVVTPANATAPPPAAEPRGLAIDASGTLAVLDGGTLKAEGKTLTRPNDKPQLFEQLDAVVQLSNGEWLVMDADQKAIHRFSRAGAYVAPFSPTRVTRLAINSVDEVAGIDRDRKNIVLFDATGRIAGRIPAKAAGYDLPNLQDLAFDMFGHLYVLDRGAVAVFSPHPASCGAPTATTAAPAAAAASSVAADRGLKYRLLTFVVEPEKNPGAFRRATAFAVDAAGTLYIADEKLQRVLVYR